MTVGEFTDLVERMREAQKRYFGCPAPSNLHKSKELEKQVDNTLSERRQKIADALQTKLF